MVDNRLPKSKRLLSSHDFSNLRNKPFILKGRFMRLFLKPSLAISVGSRIGLAVSKKVGKANKRNLIKRILREEFRVNINTKSISYDILVVAAPHIFKTNRSLLEIKKALRADFVKLLQSIN